MNRDPLMQEYWPKSMKSKTIPKNQTKKTTQESELFYFILKIFQLKEIKFESNKDTILPI